MYGFQMPSNCISQQIELCMPQFISESQFASKPKKIHQGISAARDVVSFADKENLGMALMALDMKSGINFFQKDFVYFCMCKYGFSGKTIDMFMEIPSHSLWWMVKEVK